VGWAVSENQPGNTESRSLFPTGQGHPLFGRWRENRVQENFRVSIERSRINLLRGMLNGT